MQGPIPRLSLDIDDLLCSWEETGSGSIFELVPGDEGLDCDIKFQMDPTSCRLLDLSDVQASMNAPMPAQVPDIDITAFLAPPTGALQSCGVRSRMPSMIATSMDTLLLTPPPVGIPPMLNQSAFKPAACMDWTNGFAMPKLQPPNQFLSPGNDNTWSNASSMEYCSIATPDSRNPANFHAATYPSAASAAMLLAERAQRSQLCGKSSCESWCTSVPADMPALLPAFNSMLCLLQPTNLPLPACLPNPVNFMLQPPMFPLEVVDTSCCHVNSQQHNISGNGSRLLNNTSFVLDAPHLNSPRAPSPARQKRNGGHSRTLYSDAKAPEQSSSSSTSIVDMGAPRSDTPTVALDLSRPSNSGTHSPLSTLTHQHSMPVPPPSLAAIRGQHGSGGLHVLPMASLSVIDEEQQEQRRMGSGGTSHWANAACNAHHVKAESSPCSSVGVVQHAGLPLTACDEIATRRANGSVARTACQPPTQSDEFMRSRADAVERYRKKRARRAYTKKIRYQLRKINADRRPRIKGRFVKKEEMHLYAHLFVNSADDGGNGVTNVGAQGSPSSSHNNNRISNCQDLMIDGGSDLELDMCDGLDMDGDAWAL